MRPTRLAAAAPRPRPDGPSPPPGGFRPGREGGPMHPRFPPSRRARSHVPVNRGETRMDVRRAENEPTRARVDVANASVDESGVPALWGEAAKPCHGRRSCRRAGPLRSEQNSGISAPRGPWAFSKARRNPADPASRWSGPLTQWFRPWSA